MMKIRHIWQRVRFRVAGGGAALFAFCLLTAGGSGNWETELECELAVAHLKECCPGFETKYLTCTYGGCGEVPTLTITQSHCLEQLSCSDVSGAGYCVSARVAGVFNPDGGIAGNVCE